MIFQGKELQRQGLLGKGKGGYSYLVTDGEAQYVLKQIHHEPCDYYQFSDKLEAELRDYRRLREVGVPMPALLAVDTAAEQLLKEYIEGETVDCLIRRDQMRPAYLEQLRRVCCRLYAAHLNIDYYPTNFVVRDGLLYYIDFECNEYMERWDFEHWGVQYWSKTPAFMAALGRTRAQPEGGAYL